MKAISQFVLLLVMAIPCLGQINNPPTGGSGSGTVNPNSGNAGAQAFYPAAGGSTTVGPDTLLTDSGTSLTYTGTGGIAVTTAGGVTLGTSGTAAGVLKLNGATSGTGTITAPSTTGATNPFTFSNMLGAPTGSTCSGSPALGDGGSGGIAFPGANTTVSLCGGGTETARITSNAINMGASGVFALGATTAAPDTGVSREAAAVVAVGTNTSGNETGLLRSGNSCIISADTNLTVNVASNVCSFSLPAVAKVWIIHCNLPWAITAGTGTNTMAIGVNASQTPTTTTNLTGFVWNGTTPTDTITALSASGALSIVTGTTFTPSATLQVATLDGGIAASSTAGTFAVTMTAAGTTATAAIKSGAYCRLE